MEEDRRALFLWKNPSSCVRCGGLSEVAVCLERGAVVLGRKSQALGHTAGSSDPSMFKPDSWTLMPSVISSLSSLLTLKFELLLKVFPH